MMAVEKLKAVLKMLRSEVDTLDARIDKMRKSLGADFSCEAYNTWLVPLEEKRVVANRVLQKAEAIVRGVDDEGGGE